MTAYELVVGLEIHIQLNTASKAFCTDTNRFTEVPNRNIGLVSLALPGTLPYANKDHIHKAIKLGLATDCAINRLVYFDRKNYFYPDLPKGYQLTQDNAPICTKGKINLSDTSIRINRIHMEEDAGKSIHHMDKEYSLLDYNRAGVPLLELVTEPDFRTADQVSEFILYIRRLVRYLDISDAIMQEGSLRCDVNLSIRPSGSEEFGTRCEIKNLNSASNAKKAIHLEYQRQVSLLKGGTSIRQETLDFDPATGQITPLRSKEDAHDYRYFPDPDLPPIHVDQALIDAIQSSIDILPHTLVALLRTEGVREDNLQILTENKEVGMHCLSLIRRAKEISVDTDLVTNFYVNKVIPYRKTETNEVHPYPVDDDHILSFLQLIDQEKVSTSIAYQVLLPELLTTNKDPKDLATRLDIIQDTSQDSMTIIIHNVCSRSPDKVKSYKNGKKGLLGFFMGEIMKESQGKANPKELTALLQQYLDRV